MRTINSRREMAEALRSARLKKGMTQQELADHVGVGRLLIVQLESGRANPTFDNLMKIAGLLEMSWFLGEKPEPITLPPLAQQLEDAMRKISETGSYQ